MTLHTFSLRPAKAAFARRLRAAGAALAPYGVAVRICNRAGGAARALVFAAAASAASAVTSVAAMAQEPVTIAALGDSLTQGFGLAESEGFVPQLEDWLHANGAPGVALVNAGVSGDTTAGGLARVGWTLTEDVDGVLVALGGNDLLRGLDPAETRANLDGILAEIRARGLPVLLAGLPAPGNYGPEYQAEFNAIFGELAAEHGAILVPNFLAGLGAGTDIGAARALMQSDGIHPNPQGVKAVVAALGPAALELVEAARQD